MLGDCITNSNFMHYYHPEHPWDWYISLHEWLIVMVNVGKYIVRPMDFLMGKGKWDPKKTTIHLHQV